MQSIEHNMKGTAKSGLTWRKVAAFVLIILLASVFLGIWLASMRICLIPSLFRFTGLFYAGLGLIPAVIVLIICITKHPSGNRLWLILVPLLSFVLFCFYLTLIAPAFYSQIECQPAVYSGLMVHQDCTCTSPNSLDAPVNCSLNGVGISPFVQVDFGR